MNSIVKTVLLDALSVQAEATATANNAKPPMVCSVQHVINPAQSTTGSMGSSVKDAVTGVRAAQTAEQHARNACNLKALTTSFNQRVQSANQNA